jgi:hypothetical protein
MLTICNTYRYVVNKRCCLGTSFGVTTEAKKNGYVLSPQAVATTMGKTGAKQMTKTMVYKAVKRADFEYSNAARGYVYRGEKISDAEAEKLKHKWAKKT